MDLLPYSKWYILYIYPIKFFKKKIMIHIYPQINFKVKNLKVLIKFKKFLLNEKIPSKQKDDLSS